MVTRVSLEVAKILIQYNRFRIVDLREVVSPSGKYRVIFAFAPHVKCYFTTDYLTSKTSYRFMCSLGG